MGAPADDARAASRLLIVAIGADRASLGVRSATALSVAAPMPGGRAARCAAPASFWAAAPLAPGCGRRRLGAGRGSSRGWPALATPLRPRRAGQRPRWCPLLFGACAAVPLGGRRRRLRRAARSCCRRPRAIGQRASPARCRSWRRFRADLPQGGAGRLCDRLRLPASSSRSWPTASPFLRRGLLPLGNFVSALPIVGIAPIMVMWFGFDWQSKAAVVVDHDLLPDAGEHASPGSPRPGAMERDLMRSYARRLLADAAQAAAAGGAAVHLQRAQDQLDPGADRRHRGRVLRHADRRHGLSHLDRGRRA